MDKAKKLIHFIEQDKVKESDETVEVEVTSKKYNGKATVINSYDLFSDDMGGEPFWKRIYLILVPQCVQLVGHDMLGEIAAVVHYAIVRKRPRHKDF